MRRALPPPRAALPEPAGATRPAARASRARPARALAVATLVVALSLAGRPIAAEVENSSVAREGAFGASAALLSFAYGPVKIGYALGGLALGGLSFLWTWGDKKISGTVVKTALAGDYVVTPEHLGGAQDLQFSGD